MSPFEALTAWAQACDLVDVKWFLYKETLLCASCLNELPADLKCAQVVIMAEDLSTVVESVLPLLSSKLTFNKKSFVRKKDSMFLMSDHQACLSVDILTGVANEDHLCSLSSKLETIRTKTKKKLNWRNFFRKLLGSHLGKPFAKSAKKLINKAFSSILSFVPSGEDDSPFFCDAFTSMSSSLMDRQLFAQTEMITCNDCTFPVFNGYRDYLSAVFGDYENGLSDEIGVGLTVAEKEELRRHQARCKQVLQFLQELSQEFGLRYYLLAGSVLGPMRHGGFIPWDDDVDIGIRVEELEQFEALVKEHLPQRLPAGFELVQSGPNNPYPRMFSKICYEGRGCVDLWPLVPTYVQGNKARFTWYFAKIITKVHYLKIGQPVNRFLKIAKPMAFLLSDKQVMALARWNERRYVGKNTPAYINLYSIYRREKETILRKWLDTPATLRFDDLEVPVVGCTKQYLVHLYGNYMSRPAPWKRASRHVARFTSTPADSAAETMGAAQN